MSFAGYEEEEHAPLLARVNTCHDESDERHEVTLEGRTLMLALAFPNISLLLVAADVTLVSTISATVASEFSSLSIISWLGTAYLVAMAAAQPPSGKITDIFGRRRGFIFSLCIFCCGKIVCGLAPNAPTIIIGRIISGVGGGTMSSITAFIVNDLVPLEQRGIWQGIGNAVWAVGMGLGGVLGGVINDWVGWRWAFLGLAPCTLLMVVGVFFALPAYDEQDEEGSALAGKVDLLGIFILTIMLGSLILGLNLLEGGKVGLAPSICLALAMVALIILVIVELRTADPILPIRLLVDRSITAACLSGFFVCASMHTLLFYVPLLIQVRGYSTSQVGVQMLGEPVGAFSSVLTGLAMKAFGGYGLIMPVVYLIYLAAPFGYFSSNLDTQVWVTVVCLIVMGYGFGSVLTVISTAIVAVSDAKLQAPITGMLYAFRQIGASSGLALAGVLFRLLVAKEEKEHGDDDNIVSQCRRRHDDLDPHRPNVCIVYGDALHYVFLFSLILGGIAFLCSLIIRRVTLHQDHKAKTFKAKAKPGNRTEPSQRTEENS